MKRAMLSTPTRGVIISGGSSGIGLALATALLQKPERQYKIFVTGTRPLAATELAPLCAQDDRIRYSTGDTGDEATVKGLSLIHI